MQTTIKRTYNVNRLVQIEALTGMVFQAESGGHLFQISGIDNAGESVALSGTVSGVFLRPDNTDVALSGSVSGGVVSVPLKAECYAVPGRFGLTLYISAGGSKTAIYAAMGTVSRTSSGQVAPTVTADVVDLVNRIATAVNSIPATYTDLQADIAPTYSDTAVYAVGQFAWYNGDLKRCKTAITTPETYTAAHWENGVLGNDLNADITGLKSALNDGANVEYDDLSRWVNGYFAFNGTVTTNAMNIAPFTVPILINANQAMIIDPSGMQAQVSLYNYNGTTYSRSKVESFTVKTVLVFTADQYIGINFTKVPAENITPSDFTGEILIGTDWHTEIAKNSADILAVATDVDTLQTQIGDCVITKTIRNNLYKDSDLITNYWYYVGASVNKISLTPVANTYSYGAIKIPVSDSNSSLSVSYETAASARAFYTYYFVTDDGSILSRGSISLDDAKQGVTLTIPNGAKYWLGSMASADSFVGRLMINYGNILPWERYEECFSINGFRLANKSELNKSVQDLQNQIAEDVQDLQDQIDAITPTTTAILRLPEKVEMIAGEDFELFYKGICNTIDIDLYDFEFTYTGAAIANTKAWKRKLTASPVAADVGIHAVTVVVRDNVGNEVDTGTFNLVVNAVPSSPSSEKVVLCMGDSLTTSGSWAKELKRRLTANDGTPTGFNLSNINFIGTCESGGTRFEGYGGWTFTSYSTANKSNAYMWITCTHDKTDSDQHAIYKDTNNVQWKLETIESGRIKLIRVSSSGTLPASGTLAWVSGGESQTAIVYSASEQAAGNPFWNETLGRNDFKTYALQFGVDHIDHCIILLGWNSTGTNETYYKGIARTFLDSLLDATYGFPNCKITLVGLQVPSRDGMANNYGIGWKYYTKLQHVWNLQEWYQELANEEYQTADFVCLSAQFDTEYNCITSQMDVDLRNSQKVTIQTNAVHPAPAGYLQIADAVCRNLVGRI